MKVPLNLKLLTWTLSKRSPNPRRLQKNTTSLMKTQLLKLWTSSVLKCQPHKVTHFRNYFKIWIAYSRRDTHICLWHRFCWWEKWWIISPNLENCFKTQMKTVRLNFACFSSYLWSQSFSETILNFITPLQGNSW